MSLEAVPVRPRSRPHVWEGADHAFANPSGERYDAEAAEDAWERTTAFLAEHLKG